MDSILMLMTLRIFIPVCFCFEFTIYLIFGMVPKIFVRIFYIGYVVLTANSSGHDEKELFVE